MHSVHQRILRAFPTVVMLNSLSTHCGKNTEVRRVWVDVGDEMELEPLPLQILRLQQVGQPKLTII